jgi:hypothetical protein
MVRSTRRKEREADAVLERLGYRYLADDEDSRARMVGRSRPSSPSEPDSCPAAFAASGSVGAAGSSGPDGSDAPPSGPDESEAAA